MIILSTNFNISFDTDISSSDIKKSVLSIYDKTLKDKYNPPLILPVPDEIPGEVPVAIMKSKGEHTQIILTKKSLTVGTGYDNSFNMEWKKCEAHLREKIEDALSTINEIGIEKLNFIGLVTQIIYDEVGDASRYLFDHLMKFKSEKKIYDASCRLTYSSNGKYYVNIGIENTRLYDGKPITTEDNRVLFEKEKETGNNIAFTIDVNDRFGFNFTENYVSKPDNVENIVKYTSGVISNIRDIIEKGVVEIED